MSPTERFDIVAIELPPIWPLDSKWDWVNVHDGMAPKLDIISDLIEHYISSLEVIVLIHSMQGICLVLPKESVHCCIEEHILKHDIQISDPEFTCFVTVSKYGIATGDIKWL